MAQMYLDSGLTSSFMSSYGPSRQTKQMKRLESILGVELAGKEDKPIREMETALGVARSTIWYIFE